MLWLIKSFFKRVKFFHSYIIFLSILSTILNTNIYDLQKSSEVITDTVVLLIEVES